MALTNPNFTKELNPRLKTEMGQLIQWGVASPHLMLTKTSVMLENGFIINIRVCSLINRLLSMDQLTI